MCTELLSHLMSIAQALSRIENLLKHLPDFKDDLKTIFTVMDQGRSVLLDEIDDGCFVFAVLLTLTKS